MRFFDLLSMSFRGVASNKMRSALTMLGVIIGVASVITLVSIGEGARKEVTANLESMGTNILQLYMWRWDARMTVDQLEDLKARVPDMEMIMPVVQAGGQVTYEGKERWTSVLGVTGVFPKLREHDLYLGRFFTAGEEEVNRPVAVIGWQVMQDLFAGRNPIGKMLSIDQRPHEIVGVLEEKGQYLGEGVDHQIFVPIGVAQRQRGTNKIDQVYMKARSHDTVPIVQVTVERIMESRWGPDWGQVWTQQSMLDEVQKSTRTMTLMLGAIAGVALLVGGIGVMNIMLVAVAERTREIGLRMAVGAKRYMVLVQFLAESALMCSFGGLLGVGTGIAAAKVVARMGPMTYVTPTSVIIAFGFSILVGFLFGVYPAFRASRLLPAEALRSD
ncbi:MAG: ABC transporter permease [Bacillota bacterium]